MCHIIVLIPCFYSKLCHREKGVKLENENSEWVKPVYLLIALNTLRRELIKLSDVNYEEIRIWFFATQLLSVGVWGKYLFARCISLLIKCLLPRTYLGFQPQSTFKNVPHADWSKHIQYYASQLKANIMWAFCSPILIRNRTLSHTCFKAKV